MTPAPVGATYPVVVWGLVRLVSNMPLVLVKSYLFILLLKTSWAPQEESQYESVPSCNRCSQVVTRYPDLERGLKSSYSSSLVYPGPGPVHLVHTTHSSRTRPCTRLAERESLPALAPVKDVCTLALLQTRIWPSPTTKQSFVLRQKNATCVR